jgi:Na+-translocating ferredoxin:NAD+ oxidoreductase subunit B
VTVDTTLRPLADAVALIDEARCIGCTLCIKACPVDAIVGASRFMHTVVSAWCTGCELCLAPCPVDCIAMQPMAARDASQHALDTRAAQSRHAARNARFARERAEKAARAALQRDDAAQRKRETVERAMARARARLEASRKP